jgi:hypothetical protein
MIIPVVKRRQSTTGQLLLLGLLSLGGERDWQNVFAGQGKAKSNKIKHNWISGGIG